MARCGVVSAGDICGSFLQVQCKELKLDWFTLVQIMRGRVCTDWAYRTVRHRAGLRHFLLLLGALALLLATVPPRRPQLRRLPIALCSEDSSPLSCPLESDACWPASSSLRYSLSWRQVLMRLGLGATSGTWECCVAFVRAFFRRFGSCPLAGWPPLSTPDTESASALHGRPRCVFASSCAESSLRISASRLCLHTNIRCSKGRAVMFRSAAACHAGQASRNLLDGP